MKRLALTIFLLLGFFTLTIAQDVKFQLSSHILDITQGTPAAGVNIRLSKLDNDKNWIAIDEKITDANGRIKDFLKEDGTDHKGIYKLTYFTTPYFKRLNQTSFYPFIEVIFEITDNSHYHVPITLSPYGYSTYRGN